MEEPGAVGAPAPNSAAQGLGRKASFVLANQILGSLLGFGVLLIVGRYIDPAAFGDYTFALVLLGFLPLLADGGFGQAHIYFVARGTDISRALGVYVRVRVAATLGLVLLVVLGIWIWLQVLHKPISDATTLPILGAVLALQVVSSLRQVAFDTWLGKERVNRSEMVKTFDSVLVVLFLTLFGLAIGGSMGKWTPAGPAAPWLARLFGMVPAWDVARIGLGLTLAYLTAKAVSLLPALWLWLRDRIKVGPWDAALARQYFAYALPVVIAGAPSVLLLYTDIVMLGYLKANTQVGEYGVAQKLASIGVLAATAVGTPLMPRLSALLRSGRGEDARSILQQTERILLLVGVPVSVAILVLTEPLLHIAVGDRYLGGAGAMRLISLTSVIVTATTPGAMKILASGRSRSIMVASLLAFVLNAGLNLWFIPDGGLGLGTTGPALSTFISTLAAAVYLRIVLRRAFAVPLWTRVFTRMAFAGLGAGLFWWSALRWAGPSAFDRFWELGLWAAAGTAIFAFLAWGLGMLTRVDLRAIWRVASPAGLWRELRGRP